MLATPPSLALYPVCFGDDFTFVFPAGPRVTLPLPGQHFLTCDVAHLGVHVLVTPILSLQGVHANPATLSSEPFFLRQIGINNQIKTLLRQAYGYREERFFILKLLGLYQANFRLSGC